MSSSTIFGIAAPEKSCSDQKCPFHGRTTVKKELFRGTIVKKDVNRSATLEWRHSQYLPKYERYAVRRSRMRVHNPPCLDAGIGQEVVAAKTKPLSKMKHHVILQVVER